jgi:HTH-type transcriptional regulator/antitoxin HigA
MTKALKLDEVRDACRRFANAAAPFCHIADAKHYKMTMELVESLFEEAEDSPADPLNAVISMLSDAIREYESTEREMVAFEDQAGAGPADLAMLRLLMDQHGLGTADLPEIGSKSMVSRVLSGERNFSKKHIKALSQRFGIDPGLFF